MRAVGWNGVGDIFLQAVPDPQVVERINAAIRITTSAVCGTDLHVDRGTMAGMRPGSILGHEAVGIVELVGPAVRNFVPGDRRVVCSTISCGTCSCCRAGRTAQCDNANPSDPLAGTIDGPQAERARIPFAASILVEVLQDRMDLQLSRLPGRSQLAEAIRYALGRWSALTWFLDDGRIDLDNDPVERAIRPISLGRNNSLFAGSEGGARHWAIVASPAETAKLNGVEPYAWLRDSLTMMVNGHPRNRICDLLP